MTIERGAPPSRNQAKDGTLSGLLDLFRIKLGQRWEDMLPAKVIAYDRATNRAQIQPLINIVDTLNERIERPQSASMPVLQAGAGNCVISFNLLPGDLGWIKANDRDISSFLKNYAQSDPATQRTHSFKDAVFIPDSFMRSVNIAGEDTSNMTIQTNDGNVRIAIYPDKIKITAPTIEMAAENIDMTASTKISMAAPQIEMTASTSVSIDTPLTTIAGAVESGTNPSYPNTAQFNGNIDTTGNISANGTVTGSTDVVAGGIALRTHTHGGVQTGGGNTGVPNP